MGVATTPPAKEAGDDRARRDASNADRPEGRLDEREQPGAQAKHSDDAFHGAIPAGPELDLQS